jgi:SAM-dependent methyltransferase
MDTAKQTDGGQAALWNGASGRAWVQTQDLLDRVLRPFQDLLVDAVCAEPGGRVLDVGCGTGGTTVAIARRLGEKGQVIGIDISEPMVAAARARAGREGVPASFIVADAQTYGFERASFDRVVSRFGVMFFDDAIRAFENLRLAARKDAELQFIAWRSPAENPFMTTAERAAAPLLPDLPARRPDAPGQFAFADRDKVRRILEESGWVGIEIRPADVVCTAPEKELVRYFSNLGPVGLALQGADEQTRAEVIRTVRGAFDPYVYGDEVRYTAACWMVSAKAA